MLMEREWVIFGLPRANPTTVKSGFTREREEKRYPLDGFYDWGGHS